MKNTIKYLSIILAAFLLSSCTEKQTEPVKESFLPVTPANISGSWQLTEWNGTALPEGRYFYIEFIRRDKTFASYENTSSHLTRKETGKFNILDDENSGSPVIAGRFDNSMGQEWNNRYIVTELTSKRMVWTVVGNPDDVSVYTRIDSIPAEILGTVEE